MKISQFFTEVHPLTGKREVRRNVFVLRPARRWEGRLWTARWEHVDSRWFRNIRRAGYEHAPSEVRC